MQICASKKVTTKSLDELGKNFDSRVKEWQTKLTARTVESAHIQVISCYLDIVHDSMCMH